MKSHRSLLAGLLIATVSVLGYTLWHFSFGDHELQSQVTQGGSDPSDENTQEGSNHRLFLRKNQPQAEDFDEQRRQMVREQMVARDITNPRVLDAMRKVPRHQFVPPEQIAAAHVDGPLPIGHGQTISQPYIVALMTQLARPRPDAIALDVGTGSGYQAAVLAELCQSVFSIEIVEPLATAARKRLAQLNYDNVTVRCGDGYRGWPEQAPFDLIIVAAAPDHVPQPLIDQLKPSGRLVIPVGDFRQELLVIEKQPDGTVQREKVAPVAFVPMTGDSAQPRD